MNYDLDCVRSTPLRLAVPACGARLVAPRKRGRLNEKELQAQCNDVETHTILCVPTSSAKGTLVPIAWESNGE